ncbi:MAG TPA: NADH-quinone oxidoreductase subunit H [Spirochaetota bacterium]|nr:NADH-quinone oxidoreductase subunit H [Spirochaetota bacterium]
MESFILIIAASLFFTGIIGRVKSLTAGRKGPDVLQPLRDIARNLKKAPVYGDTTGIIFRIAPSIYMASLITAALCIPLGSRPGIISFQWDFVFFVYTLALGKFFMIIAALDTGSPFEGMGASREALFSLFMEPALFMIMGSFALLTGNSSFAGIFASLHGSAIPASAAYTISGIAAAILMLTGMVENSRMPVDDPRTHLELTMIHEVMILDNSGFDLGMIMYGVCIKFSIYGAIIANLIIRPGTGLVLYALLFLAVQAGFAVFTGIVESFMSRFRMKNNPQFIYTITAATLLVFLAVMHVAGIRGKM